MTQPVTRDALFVMEKEQLVDLLVVALEGQRLATQNVASTVELLKVAQDRIAALEDMNKTQEAELIVLRNVP